MRNRGLYFLEADFDRQIYIKEETILSDFGHFHNSIEFIVMLEGEIEVCHYNGRGKISAGEIFFADSFEYHAYKRLSREIRAIVIVLGLEYERTFIEVYGTKTFPSYMKDAAANRKVIELAKQWVQEPDKEFLANMGYSNLFFSHLVRNYDLFTPTTDAVKDIIIKLLKYVNEHFSEEISLKDVAAQLGYTKEYCSKIFHKTVGRTFRDYLNSLRIKKYNEYVSDCNYSEYTKLELMYKCGFNSSATFYRAKRRAEEENIIF